MPNFDMVQCYNKRVRKDPLILMEIYTSVLKYKTISFEVNNGNFCFKEQNHQFRGMEWKQ